MKNRCILLATDLSANAAFAAKWASNYAKMAGVEVILAHVIEVSIPNWLRDAYTALEDEGQRSKLEERLQQWYETHTAERADGVKLAGGNIDQKLAQLADECDAAMIVLAKSGKGGLSKLLAGSTAQMMAANPPRPVVVVHPDHTTLGAQTRVAVATDLTESAEKAITAASMMSNVLGSHLDIVHASKFSSSSLGEGEVPDGLGQTELSRKATEQMQKVLSQHKDELHEVDFTSHIVNAGPIDAMTQFAEQHALDIVFVGNAAQYNVVTNIFGRVSVKLTQMLPCTVIVVPPHAKLFG